MMTVKEVSKLTGAVSYTHLDVYKRQHWDYIIKPEKKPLRQIETKKLLYVLCSRAKENLYLFSEHGRTTANGSEYTPTGELALITDTI